MSYEISHGTAAILDGEDRQCPPWRQAIEKKRSKLSL
jgi:hypothetical protein